VTEEPRGTENRISGPNRAAWRGILDKTEDQQWAGCQTARHPTSRRLGEFQLSLFEFEFRSVSKRAHRRMFSVCQHNQGGSCFGSNF
jgi:hypothetical protein